MILDNEHCPLPRYTVVEVWIRDEDYVLLQKRATEAGLSMITSLEDALHDWCQMQRTIEAAESLLTKPPPTLTVPHPDAIDIRDLDSPKITDIHVSTD